MATQLKHKTSIRSRLALPGAIAGFLVIGVGALWSSGVLTRQAVAKPRAVPEGLKPVIISAVSIPMYAAITRDHIWDAAHGHFAVAFLAPAEITSSDLTTWPQLAGRVLKRDKGAGTLFSESDFFPKGTRPGEAAGVPPGKRGMRFEVTKLGGVAGFRAGDHFDITSTIPIEANIGALSVAGPFKQQVALQQGLTNFKKQATVRVIVQNGVVVQPMSTRQQLTSSGDLINGLQTRNKPVTEAVIAVGPEEVGPLTEAFAVGAQLEMILRSGRPDDNQQAKTPDHMPRTPFSDSGTSDEVITPPLTFVETIEGTERKVTAAPESSKSQGK